LDKKAHSLKAYVDEILPVRNPEWLAQYRTFNKIDENSSLELADFPAFFETRRQKMLNILVDKLQLDANAPEPEPDTNPEDVYIDEPDEMLEAAEENALVEEAAPEEEAVPDEDISETTEGRQRPQGFIAAENEKAKRLSEHLMQERLRFLPAGSYETHQIYAAIQERYPDLCNDGYSCIDNCNGGNNQPEWKHKVRGVLSRLKTIQVIQYDKPNKLYILGAG
jgi:hypothetical protein